MMVLFLPQFFLLNIYLYFVLGSSQEYIIENVFHRLSTSSWNVQTVHNSNNNPVSSPKFFVQTTITAVENRVYGQATLLIRNVLNNIWT
jgi:hypothetical protein